MVSFKKATGFFLSTLSIAILISGLSSCNKENIVDTPPGNDLTSGEITLREEGQGDGHVDASTALNLLNGIPYSNIGVDNSINALRFADGETAGQVLAILEQAETAYKNEIYASVAGLSEDEVDEMEIDDDLVFETFESNISFTNSLRAKEDQEMTAFFSQEELDEENDPSDNYDYAPEFLKAVLSDNSEFRTGQEIHKIMPDGGNYTITDGDLETLEFLRGNPSLEEIQVRSNITVVDAPSAMMMMNCDANKTKSATHKKTISGKKYRAKIKLQVRNFSFLWWSWHRVYSELKSHRKGGLWNLFWKKHYTNIKIDVRGSVYYSECFQSICPVYQYNEWTGQYEIVGWKPCVECRDCEGDRVSASANVSGYNWKLKVQNNYSQRIAASDKDGSAHILRSSYQWKGYTFNLSMF